MAQFCRKCGTEVPDGQPTCPRCGGQNFVNPNGAQPGAAAPPLAGGAVPPIASPPPPAAPPPRPQPRPRQSSGGGMNGMVISGIIMVLVGLVISIGGCVIASSRPGGGSYFIFWGLIVWGAIRIIRGCGQN